VSRHHPITKRGTLNAAAAARNDVYLPEFRPAIANCTWASEYAFGTRKFTFIVKREIYVCISASGGPLPQVGHYTMDYVIGNKICGSSPGFPIAISCSTNKFTQIHLSPAKEEKKQNYSRDPPRPPPMIDS
jgi:hypothetical protein